MMNIITNLWISSEPHIARGIVQDLKLTGSSHHLLSLSLEGKLHLAPLKDDIQVRTLPLDIYIKLFTEIVESSRYWNRDW